MMNHYIRSKSTLQSWVNVVCQPFSIVLSTRFKHKFVLRQSFIIKFCGRYSVCVEFGWSANTVISDKMQLSTCSASFMIVIFWIDNMEGRMAMTLCPLLEVETSGITFECLLYVPLEISKICFNSNPINMIRFVRVPVKCEHFTVYHIFLACKHWVHKVLYTILATYIDTNKNTDTNKWLGNVPVAHVVFVSFENVLTVWHRPCMSYSSSKCFQLPILPGHLYYVIAFYVHSMPDGVDHIKIDTACVVYQIRLIKSPINYFSHRPM